MTSLGSRLAIVAGALTLSACASYRAQPLQPETAAALKVRDVADLAAAAGAVRHLRLAPIALDLSRPLTPDEIAVLVVAGDPDLKAARAKAKVSGAQVFAAGLLPDPTLNLSYDQLITGPDPLNGWAAALGFELNALRERGVTLEAARTARDQARLDLAWQEWQAAGQGRLLAARIQGLARVEAFAADSKRLADLALARALGAAARGDIRADEVETRRLAAADAADKLRVAQKDLAAARSDLAKLLGLPPDARIVLAPLREPRPPALDAAALFVRAQAERLDLLALQAGYRSQEAATRKAVMDAFPTISLTGTYAQDTAGNKTIGPAVNLALPILNANRGGIRTAEATRDQLRAEYAARVVQARADIAALVEAIRLEDTRRREIEAQAAPVRAIVERTRAAAERGDVSLAAADAARQSLIDKESAIAALDQSIAEQLVTLELAVGAPMPELGHAS